jgi:hypothetical protein
MQGNMGLCTSKENIEGEETKFFSQDIWIFFYFLCFTYVHLGTYLHYGILNGYLKDYIKPTYRVS